MAPVRPIYAAPPVEIGHSLRAAAIFQMTSENKRPAEPFGFRNIASGPHELAKLPIRDRVPVDKKRIERDSAHRAFPIRRISDRRIRSHQEPAPIGPDHLFGRAANSAPA